MADIQITGDITQILFRGESIFIMIDEYERGYVKPNGEKVQDKILSWRCLYSNTEAKRKFISKYFDVGDYVQIKGKEYPFMVEDGKQEDGYTIFIQTINFACYPKRMMREEKRAIKDSQIHATGVPDIKKYMENDF